MSVTSDDRPWMSDQCVAARESYESYAASLGYTMGDLIQMGLEQGEDMDIHLKRRLLGQPNDYDRDFFVANLEGCIRTSRFIWYWQPPLSSTAPEGIHTRAICKYVICDGRSPDMTTFDGDSDAAVESLYQEQLHLEATNDELERARAAVRSREQKAASQLARIMLEEYGKQIEERGYYDPNETWERLAPKMPAWITELNTGQDKYGYIVFESSKLRDRPLQALVQWYRVFNGSYVDGNEGTGYPQALKTVMNGRRLQMRWKLLFQKDPVDEDDPESIRKRFLELVPSLPKKMSKTTYLVVTNDCVFEELDTNELWMTKRLRWPEERVQGKIAYQDLPPFFVWAYDAAWTPPGGETPGGEGAADADGYQGRVRVDATVLLSWFFYARMFTDFTMKQLWEKAQRTPHRVWHVLQSLVNKAECEDLV